MTYENKVKPTKSKSIPQIMCFIKLDHTQSRPYLIQLGQKWTRSIGTALEMVQCCPQ